MAKREGWFPGLFIKAVLTSPKKRSKAEEEGERTGLKSVSGGEEIRVGGRIIGEAI